MSGGKSSSVSPLRRYSASSFNRAACNAACSSALVWGIFKSSPSSASIIAATTTSRVNHLLSAGTTNHGACGVAVAAIASWYAAW